MTKTMRAIGSASVLVLAALAADRAAAAGEKACEPFSVLSPTEGREVHFKDADGDGVTSPGDSRIGRRALQTAGGDALGERFWVDTVGTVDDAGTVTSRTVISVQSLPDGAIFAVGRPVEEREDYSDPGANAVLSEGTAPPAVILGGTGAYEGAEGTMEIIRDGADRIFRFNLTCDG